MTQASTPPPPGSMTVPPLFGWEIIATLLVLLAVLAVATVVALAAGKAASGKTEWQAWLEARSSRGPDPATDPADRSSVPVRRRPGD